MTPSIESLLWLSGALIFAAGCGLVAWALAERRR